MISYRQSATSELLGRVYLDWQFCVLVSGQTTLPMRRGYRKIVTQWGLKLRWFILTITSIWSVSWKLLKSLTMNPIFMEFLYSDPYQNSLILNKSAEQSNQKKILTA